MSGSYRSPTGAPLPPESTGSQGVPTYNSEDAAAHRLNPARSRTAPVNRFTTTVSRSTRVNALRSVSATLPRWPIRRSAANSIFIPCFGMMYHILASMNDNVCSLCPFSDTGHVNDWIPQVSVIVFSYLAIIQTFRAQELLCSLDADQKLFLDRFLGTFPLESIEIPGPLVPFFRSLSVSNPGFGQYSTVGPAVPPLSYDESRLYTLDYTMPNTADRFSGISMMIPNLPLMLDQFQHLLRFLLGHDQNRYSDYAQLSTVFGYTPPAGGAEPIAAYTRLADSIGFWHRPSASDGLMRRYAQYLSNTLTHFPETFTYDPTHAAVAGRESRWKTCSNLLASTGFDRSLDWFALLLRGMSTFNRHFKGNVRLSDIPPNTSTAAMIRFHGATVENIPTHNLFQNTITLNKAARRLVFNTYAETACPHVPAEDFQDAQIAQVNLSSPEVFDDSHRIGDLNVTHFGDYWQIHPSVSRTNQGDLSAQFAAMIRSPAYFQERCSE